MARKAVDAKPAKAVKEEVVTEEPTKDETVEVGEEEAGTVEE
jgi:hypothetical protein